MSTPDIAWGAGRLLSFARAPLVMGVINATGDSFFAGSRAGDLDSGLALARRMILEGADILDVGGESTRPGADYVEAREERLRVAPLVAAIRRESGIVISVDTRKADVAEAGLDAGADIVNDVSALADDGRMRDLVAARRVPVVLMHRRGDPKTMQRAPYYAEPVLEISAELQASVASALEGGIERGMIIVDPGIGFGKRPCDNLAILRGIPRLKELGFPLLIGLSRKSFLGKLLGDIPPEERLAATVVADTYAAIAGADILRVHDVKEAAQTRVILSAIEGG